jgi:hypothetical protein
MTNRSRRLIITASAFAVGLVTALRPQPANAMDPCGDPIQFCTSSCTFACPSNCPLLFSCVQDQTCDVFAPMRAECGS